MRPEDRGRFCFECRKKVHDLSAMTKDEARGFLRDNAVNDICVSYQHHEDGTLVFRAPKPAPVVPLARLRRPRSVMTAVAEAGMAAGMAAVLAACAPHGNEAVQTHAAEAPVFHSPSVVIPVGEAEPARPVVVRTEAATDEPEPCGLTEPGTFEPPAAEPERPRVRGRMPIKRTAGKPMPRKTGGAVAVSNLDL